MFCDVIFIYILLYNKYIYIYIYIYICSHINVMCTLSFIFAVSCTIKFYYRI
ncbi:MAG: hypothetical protein MCS20_01900 [Candidatus Phytoplasma mali]|nr:hypothetical protein [Candidatus Phytoplasma australiense]MCG7202143.1 hypothetical protein [Candidatus Phytoplasma mali]